MTKSILATERVIPTNPSSIAPPLSAALRHTHRRWMDETWDWLSPALGRAEFWDGWTAVRFLNDQFDRQYLPLLPATDAFILPWQDPRARADASRSAPLRAPAGDHCGGGDTRLSFSQSLSELAHGDRTGHNHQCESPPWRSLKPTPRTVANSGSPAALANFRRRLPTWTSTTLLSGSKCMSHTFSSSVVRRTTSSA